MCKIACVECLVKKHEGDFNRALSAGFGVGQHSKNDEMRLILPTTSKQVAEEMISHYGFEKLSEVSFKE